MLHVSPVFSRYQIDNEEKFSSFLTFLELYICKRCWSRIVEGNHPQPPYHHHGGLQYWLSRFKRVDRDRFYAWVRDPEHGLLHGILVAYFAFMQPGVLQSALPEILVYKSDGQRAYYADQLMMSCLFHDYYRVVEGVDTDHDRLLADIIPGLLPETYSHSKANVVTPLVAADRIELMRYPDWRDWVDRKMVDLSVFGDENLVNHFFKHLRPAFADLFEGSGEVWLSHAPEYIKECKGADVYPPSHWPAVDDGFALDPDSDKYMSVNSGRFFHKCLYHRPPGLRGMITRRTVEKYGCSVVHSPESCMYGRDHLYIYEKQKLPIDSWVFMYDRETDFLILDNEKCKFINRSLALRFMEIVENMVSRMEIFLTH